ncbi:hypothetical protein NIIDNTM18_05830 [Mycolicibacterium litorale]|uniref:Transmembrane protein n=1 Tax=Mycolicibacterium litorale TaxID=758802 RepID=A0A6S6NZ13_9MYCO|nr:hypothetical protein [Mycolicibacterium litorale]BCI51305.1 hypothetical protein NIIDNTM18_05830 [Mycolicibacterium litorale]
MTAIAYAIPYTDTVALALHGSRAPLPAVLPVLVILVTLGYRTAPRGVADAESNWIIGALVGVGALAGIELLGHRTPTLAGLWHLQDFGAPVWFACVLTVLFGVRQVVRMWPLWLFALSCASPLPLMLATAALGGSDTAAALLTAVAGAVAVFLAGRMAPRTYRAVAAVSCLAVSVLTVLAVGGQLSLLIVTVLVAAVFPTLATAALLTTHPARVNLVEQAWAEPHAHTARALGTLAVTAVALALLNPPVARSTALQAVPADWTDRTSLRDPVAYEFITRYAGPGATFVRYHTAAQPGLPALTVDVLTASDRAALADTADVIWYPSSRPVDFRAVTDRPALPAGSRIAYSNADAATDGAHSDWFLITWEWQSGNSFQRVNVVSSQSLTGDRLPPEPQPVHLFDVSLRPALWVARQQPKEAGDVDDVVVERATALAGALTRAAADPTGGAAADA